MPVIRKLRHADHPALLHLNASNSPAVARLDAAELQRLAAIGEAHHIAHDDGRILGYLLAFASGDPYPNRWRFTSGWDLRNSIRCA